MLDRDIPVMCINYTSFPLFVCFYGIGKPWLDDFTVVERLVYECHESIEYPLSP